VGDVSAESGVSAPDGPLWQRSTVRRTLGYSAHLRHLEYTI